MKLVICSQTMNRLQIDKIVMKYGIPAQLGMRTGTRDAVLLCH